MKRFFCLLLITFIFGILLIFDNQNFELKDLHKYYKNSDYFIYSYQDLPIKEKIISGNYFIYKLTNDKIKLADSFCEELVIFENKNELCNILKLMKISVVYFDENLGLIYGFSPKINCYFSLNNSKINIQILVSDDNTIKICSPFFLGFV
ncbi:MAG: hypothetical protein IJW82_02365 [Clostridia bacterium]|nr:hypothetical protein [Clostridia bacterium]